MMTRRLFAIVAAATLATLSSIQSQAAKPLEAVASFTVLADMVHQIGGDRVHITSLVVFNW